jgi:hypothetical protein
VSLWLSFDHERRATYVMAAAIIAVSARIDHELGLLLVQILGANARPALAMFDAIQSDRQQRRLLDAAAKAKFGADTEQYRVFDAVVRLTAAAQSDRHKLAHWIWGYCPELPESLLLADPQALRSRDIERERLLERRADTLGYILTVDDAERKQEDDAINKLYEADPSAILVYGHADLQNALTNLFEAMNALAYYRYFVSPMKVNQLAAPLKPELADLETSDGALRRLNSLRLFREAFRPATGPTDPSSNPPPQS